MKLSRKHTSQAGLSLVELMVSITIGLVILAALTTLFVNQNRTRTELDKSNRMIDNGRYALDLLSDNLRLAGFYGEYDGTSGTTPSATQSDPCSTSTTNILAALPFHVQGFDASGATSTVDLSATTCTSTNIPATIKAGSDVLVIRRASTATVAAASAVANTDYLQVPQCRYEATTPVLCKAGVTGCNFNLSTKSCTAANSGPFAALRAIKVQIFYIDSNNKSGDGVPTLKMTELVDPVTYPSSTYPTYTVGSFTPPIPLVEGIEYMQINYGVDSDNDGVPNSYVESTTDWSKVVSVKLNIIARNLDTSPNFTDNTTYKLGTDNTGADVTVTPGGSYKRHAYTEVVRLTNPAGRKE